MTDPSRRLLGNPLPSTPQRRGGHLENLLAQFGSQNSAESVTKTRRVPTQATPKQEAFLAPSIPESKRKLRHQQTPNYAHPRSSTTGTPESPKKPTAKKPATRKASPKDNSSSLSDPSSGDSEDELAQPPLRARGYKKNLRSNDKYSDLKMEARKKTRDLDGPKRRSGRHTRVLESDTVPVQKHAPSPRRKAAQPPKLDTTRARLRDEIARKSKAKANNFLVANKDYFLPLLPPNNYVSKLVISHNVRPVVEYKELKEQPKGVTATMKPYQLSGLSYMVHLYNNGFSGILGDEMGLGKTLQTLSLFQYLEELDRKMGATSEELRPYLVVCPLSVLNSWVTEAQKWVPELKVLRIHGTKNERDRLKRVATGMEDMQGHETELLKGRKASRKAGLKRSAYEDSGSSYKIIVTTYDTFQADASWFKHSFLWRYVVLDEGHKIKSNTTNISTSLRNVNSEYRMILTGTPLQNNLLEMWALLAWLYPDVFTENTQDLFRDSFDLTRGKVNKKTMDDARHLLELVMLRRMKDSPNVNLGLPPKEEILLYVPLTPMQRFWYTRLLTRVGQGMLNDLFANGKEKEKATIEQDKQDDVLLERMQQLETRPDTIGDQGEWEETAQIMRQALKKEQETNTVTNKSAWQKLMNLVMQLRKCCSHPYLLPGVSPDPYYLGEHIIRASGKFILLDKLLKHTVLEQGKKVLIFSGFTHTLDCCEDLLSMISNHGTEFKHLRLDGSTGRARRNLDIRLFNQAGSDYKVMLLSTRAGGLGINLTSAQDVIFLDEDWNPQITLQAEARAHRIGQTQPVTIYKLCTQGTVEEQMMGRIRKKLYLSAKITESMRNVHYEQTPAKAKASVADDMPQMDSTQLKTLIRRGAQTLSHPEIDVTEMLSWDLPTMMAKCRDKPADETHTIDPQHPEADEEKWLSVMERVECAVFDGKRFQRQKEDQSNAAAANILPDSITREDRRRGKNTTVMVDGFAVSKESMNCGDWEAVPTFAGKDASLADPVKEKKREISHEEHCLECFNGDESGHLVECKSCPRAYHYDCLTSEYQSKVKGFNGFYCSQHNCVDCGKNTTDAGGLIFRCRWCPHGFCEDCLEWDKTTLVGQNLPELEIMGEPSPSGGFYIKCPDCVEACENSKQHSEWMTNTEIDYQEQHDAWLKERKEAEHQLEQNAAAVNSSNAPAAAIANEANTIHNGRLPTLEAPEQREEHVIFLDEAVLPSPPALTDTSLPTPAIGGSRISTPTITEQQQKVPAKAKRYASGDGYSETRFEKKARLDGQAWSIDDDPLFGGLAGSR
ncbi:ISWI chromatin-remodeling complex ATPase ISW2 [Didymella exigua CBS 183.55]|uniref:ISWI chromatin-remodeling complex ATPase ISW2 n=1 Tax=Didymella exigua CBS 183.55 TaxID=1150837 RepID=A0A6A5R7V2_9PLEO|nr:ISWI chromatin-remodeling complex ATPase ISW2 [Didymella exigua CBS 183.55]KAF1924261.1 ISWI chromatin-remodeling complex ATPase ISW2 [Didymella exigua CBS 183.55]